MVLCFKFVTKAVWKTQGCFILLLIKADVVLGCFLLPTLPCQESRLAMHKELAGDTAGTTPWISPQLISTILCHVQHVKLGQEGKKGGCLELQHLPLQVTFVHDDTQISRGGRTPVCP